MHLFTLTQNSEFPCLYEYEDADFGFIVTLDISTITPIGLKLQNTDLDLYFEAELWAGPPVEHMVFTNSWQVCGPNVGVGGFATMFWLIAARAIIDQMVLPTDPQIMLEFFVTDSGDPVYKYCVPKYSMNVKFLVSP